MKIAVRMDDITPDMDWEKFLEFKALLDKYEIRPLIGVVPDNKDENLNRGTVQDKDGISGRKRVQDKGGSLNRETAQGEGGSLNRKTTQGEDRNRKKQGNPGLEKCLMPENFWEYIRSLQSQGWIVAMHGWQHVYTQKKGGIFPLNHFSEFAGLDFGRQLAMLEKGRAVLETHGIKTDIFMAPAHSYDRNTLKALNKTGFTKMTDGFGKRPYIWKGIHFYPISFRLENSLKRKEGITTMVIHTNTMERKDMEKCGRIFEKNEIISYADYLKSEAVKRSLPGRWAEYCMATVKHVLVKLL